VGVATGLYLTSSTVSTVDAALATTYGRVLLVKIGLVGLMVTLAALNHRRLHGPHDLDVPRRGVRAEAVAAVLVLAATGVLTSAQPATEPQFQRQPEATAGPVSSQVDDLRVQIDVAPAVPGLNVLSVDVFDTRRPAPGEVTTVSIAVGDGVARAATPLGNGRWSVAGVDLRAGPRELHVTVTRPGVRTAELSRSWTIGAGDSARRTVLSTAPLSGILQGLALALGLVGGVVWWLARPRRRDGAFPIDHHDEAARPVDQDPEPAHVEASGALTT
jgi:copper transport protein